MLSKWYANLLYLIVVSLIRTIYGQGNGESFQPHKHDRMIGLATIAEKIYRVMVAVVSKKTRDNFRMAVDYQGCKLVIRPFIFPEIIMVSGLWENYVKDILFQRVRSSDTVIDVGANIGVYAVPLAMLCTKVIAFEPHPVTFEMLKESVKLNDLKNVVLLNKAVGGSRCKERFSLSSRPMNSGISTQDDSEAIEVECVDLDTTLATENRIDWLIIDVEGFEENVVNGARKLIRIHSPHIIIESDDRIRKESVKKILETEGYSLDQIYGMYYYAAKTAR